MQDLYRHLDLRRMGAALATCLGIAAALIPVSSATAATVTLSGGTSSCTYSNVTGTAGGDFTFTCSGATSPGVLALNTSGTATSIPVSTGSTTFSVTRTGGTAGATSGNLAVTAGSCTLSTPSVSFVDGGSTSSSNPVTLNAAGSAAGTSCTVTLTLGSGTATIGSPPTVDVGIVDPNAPVAFSFAAASSTAYLGGSPVTITVTRTGGTGGAWDVPFTLSSTSGMVSGGALVTGGGSLNPSAPTPGKVSFPAGSGASQSVVYTPPSTAPGGVTLPASFEINGGQPVQTSGTAQTLNPAAIANHTVTLQAPQGCATTATYTVPWNGSQTIVSQVKQNESAAVTMTPTGGVAAGTATGKFVIAETSSTGDQADVQFTVSACPGDFSPSTTGACARHTQYSGGTLTFSIGPKPPGTPFYIQVCELPLGTTTVYFNFRQIKRPTPVPPNAPGTPSCQWTTCPVYVQFN